MPPAPHRNAELRKTTFQTASEKNKSCDVLRHSLSIAKSGQIQSMPIANIETNLFHQAASENNANSLRVRPYSEPFYLELWVENEKLFLDASLATRGSSR